MLALIDPAVTEIIEDVGAIRIELQGRAEIALRCIPPVGALERYAARVIEPDETAVAFRRARDSLVVGRRGFRIFIGAAQQISECSPDIGFLWLVRGQGFHLGDAGIGLTLAAV